MGLFLWYDFNLPRTRCPSNKKIILVAGKPSHGPGEHGPTTPACSPLRKCLDRVPGIAAVAYTNGWPQEPNAFDGADAIRAFHGRRRTIIRRFKTTDLNQLNEAMKRGAGLAFLHYAVEAPQLQQGRMEFLNWIGGYFKDQLVGEPNLGRRISRRLPDTSDHARRAAVCDPVTSGTTCVSRIGKWARPFSPPSRPTAPASIPTTRMKATPWCAPTKARPN